MRKTVATLVFLAVSMIGLSGVASADLDDYLTNPGYLQSSSVSCNSGHGAFQYFQGQRGGWVPDEAQQGGIGDTTGPANSGFAAGCRAQ